MEALDLILVVAAGWTVLLMLVVGLMTAASRADDATDELLAGMSGARLESETVIARVRTRQRTAPASRRKLTVHSA